MTAFANPAAPLTIHPETPNLTLKDCPTSANFRAKLKTENFSATVTLETGLHAMPAQGIAALATEKDVFIVIENRTQPQSAYLDFRPENSFYNTCTVISLEAGYGHVLDFSIIGTNATFVKAQILAMESFKLLQPLELQSV